MTAQAFAQARLVMAGEQRATCVSGGHGRRTSGSRGLSRGIGARVLLGWPKQRRDSPNTRRDALWGQVMCASALELGEAHELLEMLESTSSRSDPYELVRMADKKLGMDFRFGAIRHLGDARRVAELVGHIEDPFVRCSFRCTFSCALNLERSLHRGARAGAAVCLRTPASSASTSRSRMRSRCLLPPSPVWDATMKRTEQLDSALR